MNEHEQKSVQLPPVAAFESTFPCETSLKCGTLDDLIRLLFANEEGVIRIAHSEILHTDGNLGQLLEACGTE